MEDDRTPYNKPIDPAREKNALSLAMDIDGLNRDGSIPPTQINGNIQISSFQSSATVSSNNILFIPVIFQSQENVTGAYLQVEGAENHWEMPIAPDQNQYTMQVGMPANVMEGTFNLVYQLFDGAGSASAPKTMEINILDAISECQGNRYPRISGRGGVTGKRYILPGNEAREVTVSYYMYSVPDRIDISYGGEWVYSSGTVL